MQISAVIRIFGIALLLSSVGDASKILVMLGFSSESHMNIFWPMIDGLQARGHQVTVVTTHPGGKNDHPGVEKVELKEAREYSDRVMEDVFEFMQEGLMKMIEVETDFLKQLMKHFFNHPTVKKLLTEKPHYDVIIMDIFESYYVVQAASLLKAPLIYVDTSYIDTYSAYANGIPSPYSYVPNTDTQFSPKMTFLERLSNTKAHLAFLLMMKYLEYVSDKEVLQYLPDVPPVAEINKNISLIIANSDPVMDVPRPFLPNVVRVGAIHIKKHKPLPKDLQDFIESAGEEGFIMMGLGSILVADKLPISAKNAFLKTFSEIKQKVIWKFEGDIPDLPKNIKLVKWLPQQDMLSHPKCRLFITHSGLLSVQEAIHKAVPMIGVPVFAEQPLNCARAKELGFGECIDVYTVTYEEIRQKVQRILTDPSYTENAKKYSNILKDEPLSPVDRAIFWIEYVIRHRGASHLLTPVHDLSFIQYFCIDIIALVLLLLITGVVLTILIIRLILKAICKNKSNKKLKQK